MAIIVPVHSYRGGTGKSNLTANLAAAAAARGLRAAIVDADIQSPGVHILFGLQDRQINRTLNDYLRGGCEVEETAYRVTPPGLPGEVFLVPSALKAGEIARILREGYDAARLNDGFHDLIDRLRLDALFIDSHPGLNEETLLAIAVADAAVLILRPDQQDFQGTAVTVEVARKLGVRRLLLVVNKALPGTDFAALKADVERTYDAPVAAVLPLAPEMLQLGSAGLFALRHPGHELSRGIARLADQLLDAPE